MRPFQKILAPALLAAAMAIQPATSFAGVGISITVGPPLLPVYALPPIPGPDYIWTPGYWAYDDDDEDYYWVPGTWVLAPEPGLLWTPGYWGWNDGVYAWNAGYWGPHVGYYGGIDYGCGYGGVGYEGGHWSHGSFFYNTTIVHVDRTIIHNTYNKTVINNTTINRVSFNGGNGGTTAKPTSRELEVAHERHVGPTEIQAKHQHTAMGNRALFASVNHGAPSIAATAKPGVFTGHGIAATKGSKAGLAPNKLAVGTPLDTKSKPSDAHTTFKAAKNPTGTPVPGTANPPQMKSITSKNHEGFRPNQMNASLGQNQFKTQHRPPAQQSVQHGPPAQHFEQHPRPGPNQMNASLGQNQFKTQHHQPAQQFEQHGPSAQHFEQHPRPRPNQMHAEFNHNMGNQQHRPPAGNSEQHAHANAKPRNPNQPQQR